MKKAISIFLVVFIFSCSSKKEKIEKSTDMAYLSGLIENYMFVCTEANQLEVHTKAKYDPTDSTLTFYIGKSKTEFFQKWNIPLKRVFLDLENINSTIEFRRSLKIKGIDNESVIRYSDNKPNNYKMTKSFNIYLFDWCDRQEREHFISALKRLTELSKLE